jgi:hypothetical protein
VKEAPPAARGSFVKPPLHPVKLLSRESFFTVLPSVIGNVTLITNTFSTGPNEIKFNISNSDSSPGLIPLTITILDQNSTPILTETRSYFLQPNESQSDFISYTFPQKNTYTLQISSPKISTPINTLINILNPDETNTVPITADISNTGFNPFNGTL